ncbi:MAG: hypothetical protein PHS98_03005, partial [Bacilli bacterium]|nr:hypothetical protein [Bacilli bacterium]
VFVDKLGSKLNKERDLNYYSKANYTYPEIAEFYQTFCNDKVYDIDFKFNDRAYTIIHKYDSSVVENMISYSSKVNSLLQNNISLYAELKKPYYNDEKITADIVATIYSVLYIEYLKDNMMLKDIIKVGEMNE